jgi:RNA ligase (TIGR02306 family)
MNTNICTIEEIQQFYKHPNADNLIIVKILGYDVIVNRELFPDDTIIGKKGVFFHPDAVIPENLLSLSVFALLKKNHRIKTIKLRGCFSQGLFLPLEKFNIPDDKQEIGTDLTEFLAVEKWQEPTEEKCIQDKGFVMEPFPDFIPKTEQTHLQKETKILENNPLFISMVIILVYVQETIRFVKI